MELLLEFPNSFFEFFVGAVGEGRPEPAPHHLQPDALLQHRRVVVALHIHIEVTGLEDQRVK